MSECKSCGTPVTDKNAAGHYRDRCQDCIAREARRRTHYQTCEDAACLVCESYEAERCQ